MPSQLVDDVSPNVIVPLVRFEAASPTGVKRIVLASAAKSCELEAQPSSLLKRHIEALSPILSSIITASLSSALVPQSMKHAVVTPILKTHDAGLNALTNYRSISNISCVAKTIERFVARQ